MKKIIVAIVFVFILAADTFAQTDVMLNLKGYSSLFLNGGGRMDSRYSRPAPREERSMISALGGEETSVDTPLEIALLSTCAGVVDVRPVQASEMLGTAKQADLKLGAAVFQEIQVLRFLSSGTDASRASASAALGRHEGVLKFITDRGNVTRAEVEAYYRSGIRELISQAVDEEFGRVSFRLDWYNAALTRTSANQYILSYEDVNDVIKELPPASLETLLATMRNNRTEFKPNDVDTVRDQAALIPAVVYAEWKSKGVANGVDGMALITETLTNFYLNPNTETYNMVRGVYSRYYIMSTVERDGFSSTANSAYIRTIDSLNIGLGSKVVSENKSDMASALNRDNRYRIFSTPYAVGNAR